MELMLTAAGKIGALGIGKIAQIGGTLLSTAGAVKSANTARATADYEAKQMEQRAMAERASASREAAEEHRQKRLVQSRARAVGAASGGGVDVDLIGDIAEEGEIRALSAIWGGSERAAGMNMQADTRRAEGAAQASAARYGAATTLLDGFGMSLYDKYRPVG